MTFWKRSVIASGKGKDIKAQNKFFGDRTVLYSDCYGGYMNLKFTELHTT